MGKLIQTGEGIGKRKDERRKRERMSFQKDVNQKVRTINSKKKDIKSGKRGKYKKKDEN